MRTGFWFPAACLGLASLAPAQRFGFTRQMLPADAEGTSAIALGDVDGDGDLDAFVGSPGSLPALSELNRLHVNDGTGVFRDATATNLPLLPGSTHAVALGDVDGDGDLDALLGLTGQNRLYLNAGGGAFADATATNLPLLFGTTRAIALGDVDGDGDLDAFTGNSSFSAGAEQNRIYVNGGAGVFTDSTATSLPSVIDDTRAVALRDVEGDGDLDAFVGNSGPFPTGGQNRLYLNGGAGIFADATATSLPLLPGDTRAVALADVDGDGDLDAFVGNTYDPDRLYLNGGGGTFAVAPAAGLPASDAYTTSLAMGDVDGDGDLDVFLGRPGQCVLRLNDGTGAFPSATATSLAGGITNIFSVALGDVDGDGDLDAFQGDAVQDRLYLNDATGDFTDVTAVSLPASGGWAVLGDLDGDGDSDAFVARYATQNRLYVGDGTGRFADVTATNLPVLLGFTAAVALGDVDGDGDLDGFLGNEGQDRLYVNGGTGVFTDSTATSLPPLSGNTRDVALGDVDGDGDLDAFLGNFGFGVGDTDRLLLNTGTGLFTDATATSLPAVPPGFTGAIALGDVDGDGDLDAYLGRSDTFFAAGGQDRLYLNNGLGVLTDATGSSLPAMLEHTNDVALGDVDGDGDLDAFLGRGYSGLGEQSRLYLNGGTGIFGDSTATNLPALPESTEAVALGDFDGDGDLDAILGNPGQSRFLLNGGTGVFADATASDFSILSEATVSVAVADLDGDGDLDAFFGNSTTCRVYTNLTRQLSWRGIPRVGKPLVFDVRGPANALWFLAFSTGTASVPLPPLGTLRLDPGNVYQVFTSLLDPLGRGGMLLPVPANGALIGASVYWQALVLGPARLTNLEITTVTGL